MNKDPQMEMQERLKLKEIDQLESAILQFSKNTMTAKSICASLLVGIATVVLKVTNSKIDSSIFIGSLITINVFWFIDSHSYYYQRKLRIRMTAIVNELNAGFQISDGFGIPLRRKERVSLVEALFNSSHLFYYIGLVVYAGLLFANIIGLIK